jgi:hypothetical protein
VYTFNGNEALCRFVRAGLPRHPCLSRPQTNNKSILEYLRDLWGGRFPSKTPSCASIEAELLGGTNLKIQRCLVQHHLGPGFPGEDERNHQQWNRGGLPPLKSNIHNASDAGTEPCASIHVKETIAAGDVFTAALVLFPAPEWHPRSGTTASPWPQV